jgi:hypothetical protein
VLQPADLVQLAQAHLRRREFLAAESLLLRAWALFGDAPGEELNVSVCLNNLGMLYHVVGDDDRAEPLLRQVADMRHKILGERHPMYLNSLKDLAEFFRSRSDLAQADVWQRQADVVEKNLANQNAESYHE